jgi:hypothetical protein
MKNLHTYPPMEMEQTGCPETLAYKLWIAQKKPYKIQNTANEWNKKYQLNFPNAWNLVMRKHVHILLKVR